MASNAIKVLLVCLFLVFSAFNLSVLQMLISTIALLVFGFLIGNASTDAYRLPPGPKGLPFIGSLHSVIYQGIDEFHLNLSKQYGGIVTIKLGGLRSIIINDFDTMKEFSNHPDFQGRPDVGILRMLSEGYGILDSEGQLWKHQRRFMMHSLRDSGMGKINMEEKIINALETLTTEMAKFDGKPMEVGVLLEKATCNVIFGLSCDKSFDYDNPTLISVIENMNEIVLLAVKFLLTSMFEFLKIFAKNSFKIMVDDMNAIREVAKNFIREHEQSIDEDNPRDFIDLYLTQMKKDVKSEDREYQSTFTELQLLNVIGDLFGAGTETSSTTIRWAILYMIHHPEVQKKVQDEIDDVIGRDRPPVVSDKLNLPFTVATLQEVERLASVVPRGLPRSNQAPAKFRQYFFPERCMFTLNIHAIHRDPKLWDNPEEFKPERFINKEGNVFRPPFLVPFGSGKRSCAGESLARMEIYLVFVTLMQKFTFLPPHGKLPQMKPYSGFVRGPTMYEVVAKLRD